jgi:hypothetical protein
MRAIPPRIPPQTDPNQAKQCKDSDPPLARRPYVVRVTCGSRAASYRKRPRTRLAPRASSESGHLSVSTCPASQNWEISVRSGHRSPAALFLDIVFFFAICSRPSKDSAPATPKEPTSSVPRAARDQAATCLSQLAHHSA